MIELTTTETDLISAGTQEVYAEYHYLNGTAIVSTIEANATHYSLRPREAYYIDPRSVAMLAFGGLLLGAIIKITVDVFIELLAKIKI